MDLGITISEYSEGVYGGSISAEEFVAASLDHIRSTDDTLHAFLSVLDGCLDRARDIDRRIRAGEDVGVMPGVPVGIKDNICIRGSKTTCASRMLQEYVSPYDATVITRLQDEGAIPLGKTNMDEFAMGLSTEFSAFGPSRNPWDTGRVPGGSSGGSAVSVASLQCMVALGSDTGGSIRNPASFCGVVGFKPTYGLVSRYGLISYANSVEQIGPMARTVRDCAILLGAIAGPDPNDHTTMRDQNTDYLSRVDEGVEGRRVGVILEMTGDGVDSGVLASTRQAVAKLEGLGATCDEVSLDMIRYSVAAYYTITATEAGSNLARYDNIRYGYDIPPEGYGHDAYVTTARDRLGPEVRRRMILGGFVPSAGHAGRYFLKALRVKAKLARQVAEAFKKYDILVAPTVPVPPFKLGEKTDDPVSQFLVDANTVTASLAGTPAVSVPVSVRDGLPVGLQMMGGYGNDASLLAAACALEGAVGMPRRAPA